METNDISLVFIRHGKTKGNLERRYIGRTDEPLCDQGRTELLSNHYPDAEIIITSPMKRCLETTGLLYPGIPYQIEPQFRETDFGQYEGKTYEQLKNDPDYRSWIDSRGLGCTPEGEDGRDFQNRCRQGFQKWAESLQKTHVSSAAFILHGGVIMSILSQFSADTDFYQAQIPNGGYLCSTLPRSGIISLPSFLFAKKAERTEASC